MDLCLSVLALGRLGLKKELTASLCFQHPLSAESEAMTKLIKRSVQTRKQKRKDYFKRASKITSKQKKTEKTVTPVNYKKLFVQDVAANYSTSLQF